jgi:TrmH family RNA methyltransferase
MQNELLDHIHFVLVGTTHPGNIGATARALKTMGLRRLDLVATSVIPSAEATARASGADDLLAAAGRHESLAESLSGCGLVLATSGRSRNIDWPVYAPEEAMALVLRQAEEGADVAIVFGRESSGLSNAELDLCHGMIRIPTDPEFKSLNLAAAAQILSYELRRQYLRQSPAGSPPEDRVPPAEVAHMDRFYVELQSCLAEIGYFDPEQPRLLMRRLKRLFNRSRMDLNEYNIMMGFIRAARKAAGRKD